jgi:hypothetical protein
MQDRDGEQPQHLLRWFSLACRFAEPIDGVVGRQAN